jgi:cytochrome c peroxidase
MEGGSKPMTKRCCTSCLFVISGLLLSYTSISKSLEALSPLPLTAFQDVKKVALGEKLFSDPRLSSQKKRSCASCHPLDSGAMDGRIRAESADGISILRNTPTLFNVAYNYFYNWDGIVTTLETHTEKVMLNPKIMNATWPGLLATLNADARYRQAFSALYADGLTKENLVDAVTSFELSLITPNARFDRYLKGEKTLLDSDEQRGYELFISLGCVSCHQGTNIGGNLFQKFGIFGKPKGNPNPVDEGRFSVTKNERDRGVYRVPSLRNVAVTAPYFHDGRAATLEEAVDIMAKNQLGKVLAAQDRKLVIKFLNTLTGEYLGKPVVRRKVEPK